MLSKEELQCLMTDIGSDRVERTTSTTDIRIFEYAICAFSNDLPNYKKPGYLLIGVDKTGKLSGLKATDELLQNISDIPSNRNLLPQPAMTVNKYSFDEGDVIVVEVMPAYFPPVYDRGVLVWIGVGLRRNLANEAEKRLLLEKRPSFDEILLHSSNRDNRIITDSSIFNEPNPQDDLANQIEIVTKRTSRVTDDELRDYNISYTKPFYLRDDDSHNELLLKWKQKILSALPEEYRLRELDWSKRKQEFYDKQNEHNTHVANLKDEKFSTNNDAIIDFNKFVLNRSVYPQFIKKKFDLEYDAKSKMLLVEYFLPHFDVFPKEKGFVKEKLVYFSDSALFKIFDKTCYNITLRVIHELFEADEANVLDIINFNGWVDSIDRATGQNITNCILSIQVKKSEFQKINLRNVDPKACFKYLKGVACSKLSAITSIQPILQINKNDKRFIANQSVETNNSTNLASMDWDDFEHLVREVFEAEFITNGGEVKVTQASRDGGVDAIAFDPDPIRGGKIIIQAKRYTNTVGVSAVRDLYGTIINEGATKGILITTADYGSDSYEFAKGKPITLLNGGHLLFLLDKHGRKAKIDIAEAKKMQRKWD